MWSRRPHPLLCMLAFLLAPGLRAQDPALTLLVRTGTAVELDPDPEQSAEGRLRVEIRPLGVPPGERPLARTLEPGHPREAKVGIPSGASVHLTGLEIQGPGARFRFRLRTGNREVPEEDLIFFVAEREGGGLDPILALEEPDTCDARCLLAHRRLRLTESPDGGLWTLDLAPAYEDMGCCVIL